MIRHTGRRDLLDFLGTRDVIPELFVERWEFGAVIEDANPDQRMSGAATEIFRALDEVLTEPATLIAGIDRQQSEVTRVAAQLDVIAPGYRTAVLGDYERPRFEMLHRLGEVYPFSRKERPLDDERTIDQKHESVGIRFVGVSIPEFIRQHGIKEQRPS